MYKADKKLNNWINIDMNTKVQVSYSLEIDFMPPIFGEAHNKVDCLSYNIRFKTFQVPW